MHQAGSDSFDTISAWNKLKQIGIITQEKMNIYRNILDGIEKRDNTKNSKWNNTADYNNNNYSNKKKEINNINNNTIKINQKAI